LVDHLFHDLSGLELDDFPGGNIRHFLGDRISSDPRRGFLDLENPEITDLDTAGGGQRIDKNVSRGLYEDPR